MRFSQIVVTATTVLIVCACGGSETAPKTSTLSIGSDSTLLVDEVDSLTPLNESGTRVAASSLTWSSSAPNIATVDANGRVKALGVGQTTISAASPNAHAHATIAVAAQFLQIATGQTHACGITGRNALYCWGSSVDGALGSATSLSSCDGVPCSATPVLATHTRFTSVAAGAELTCALDASNAAYCWGTDFYGQLGNGRTTETDSVPQLVLGGHQFAQLAAGGYHVCGITTAQDAYCWGEDETGQLGAGDVSTESCVFLSVLPCSSTPRLVAGGHKWSRLSASDRTTCGVATTGVAYCWGFDSGSSDGLECDAPGEFGGCSHTPIPVDTNSVVRDIRIGLFARCEQTTDQKLGCWKSNFSGAFGNGTTDSSATPVPAAGGASYASFVASRYGVCALGSNGHAQCWGADNNGEVGNGTVTDLQLTPADVSGGYTFAALSSSSNSEYVCGITSTGRALCWGFGIFAQLGNGGSLSSSTPQLVQLVATSPPSGSVASTR